MPILYFSANELRALGNLLDANDDDDLKEMGLTDGEIVELDNVALCVFDMLNSTQPGWDKDDDAEPSR